jgi:hypothetical protein
MYPSTARIGTCYRLRMRAVVPPWTMLGGVVLATSLLACPPPPTPESPAILVVDASPDDDPELSPYTGWTRDHHVALFARLVVGHGVHRSEGAARTELPGGEDHPESMEGAIRLLPALAAWLSNEDENPEVIEYDGVTVDLAQLARDIIIHGTDPDHPDYWGEIALGWDQRSVEAAAVADAILRARGRVWTPLTEPEQDQVMKWLAPTSDSFPNNWSLFVAMRNLARFVLGYDYPAEALAQQLDTLEPLLLGDGWYSDGDGAQVDLYNGFVIHPRRLAWAQHASDDDPGRADRIRAAARAYVATLPYFFASDGAMAQLGRSLAYRSAHLDVLAAAEHSDANPLAPGLTRRIASGALAWDVGGAPDATDRALGPEHVLRNGLRADDPRARESYMRNGSHYFFAQGLSLLAFGPEHPIWSEPELPLPADEGPFAVAFHGPGFALTTAGPGSPVTLLNAISAKGDTSKYHDRYRKLTYASHFPFNTVDVDGDYPYDGMLTASFAPGRFPPRDPSSWGIVAPGWMSNRYTVGTAEIHTATWARGDLQVRFACLVGTTGSTYSLIDGSHAIATVDAEPLVGGDAMSQTLRGDASTASLQALFGWDRIEAESGFAGITEVNAVHDEVWTLSARADDVSPGRCVASAHTTTLGVSPPTLPEIGVAVDEAEQTIELTWGSTRVYESVAIDVPPGVVSLGDQLASGSVRLLSIEAGRVVAVGVSTLSGPRGELDSSTDLDAVSIHTDDDGTARVTLTEFTSAVRVRVPDVGFTRVVAIHPGGEPMDVSGEIDFESDSWIRVPPATWSRNAGDLGMTRLTLELHPS